MAYRKIDESKLYAIADKIRERLNDTQTMDVGEMPILIDDIGIGRVPDYWRSYLVSKAAEINCTLDTAGENKSAFLWYTDAHWTTNYGKSPMILKYLYKHSGMKKTFFGGDVAAESAGEIELLRAWQAHVSAIPNHHSVIGNHDNQVTELTTAEARADFFLMPERTGDMVNGTDATNGKMYYYIDNHIEKTRYICLSTGRMWTFADEVEWCIDALNSTPKNWHIIVISHLWLNNDYDNGGIITAPERYTQVYLDLFDAYNYRESGTTEMHSTAYDFANSKAKVEFVIGGHVHQDYDFTTARGIPVILTECDAWQERDDVSVAQKGTITENCVYAIVADYTAKSVKVINVGRGDTRSVAIPDVVTYTNWIKKSINADGTIYNDGKGYKENYRLNSSGTEASRDGYYITGFIPCRVGDIVRLENLDYMAMDYTTADDGVSKFVFYNESFAYITNSSHKPDNLPSAAWSAVYREDGNVKQVTIPTVYGSSVRYMRLCAKNITDASIITVNEEIT